MQGRILAGVFAGFSVFGLFGLGTLVYVAFACKRRVALTHTHIILPRPTRMGLSRDEIQIPFDAITNVNVCKFVGAAKQLRLDRPEGVISIPSNMFQNRAEFDDLCRNVQKGTDNAAHGDSR